MRIATRILLLVALAASSLTLTHCRMVGDRLTGISVGQFNQRSNCVKACNESFRAQMEAENALHQANVRACSGDPVCLEEEDARREAAIAALQAAHEQCINGCHTQGGGSAGH